MPNSRFAAFALLYSVAAVAAEERVALAAFRALTVERLDPNISPGQVSQHTHRVIGGNKFSATYDPEAIRTGTCSNLDVQADMSNYWTPQLYWQHPNGSYTAIGGESRVYYETFLPIGNFSTGVQTEPFPHNFQMVAGNPARKTPPASTDFSTQAVFYWCATTPDLSQGVQYWGFPDRYCYELVAKVYFPSCWNGQAYDVNNPTAHMRYPVDNIGVGGSQQCPQGFERRLPLLLLETFYYGLAPMQNEAFRAGTSYLLANGDTTGYGLHADFQNGWQDQVLHDFVYNPTCQRPPYVSPASVCPPLAPFYRPDIAQNCRLATPIVNELVGMDRPLVALPGCNKPWSSGIKPTCRTTYPPGFVQSTIYGGWDNIPLPP